MDVALCTLNQITYTVQLFEALSAAEIGKQRKFLVCPECKGPGFYRKESTSGQAACFGARPHAPKCGLAAAEARHAGGMGPDQDERINLGERIEVDFNYGTQEVDHSDPGEPSDASGRGGRYVNAGSGPRRAVMHRRLSTLLKNLIHAPDFQQSEQLIAMPEGEFRVKDFFVDFRSIDESLLDEYRGYWGMLSDSRFGRDNALWLNTGGRDDVSLVVDEASVGEFGERFDVKSTEDLAGSYVLVFGRLKKSSKDKKYISISDIGYCTISLA